MGQDLSYDAYWRLAAELNPEVKAWPMSRRRQTSRAKCWPSHFLRAGRRLAGNLPAFDLDAIS